MVLIKDKHFVPVSGGVTLDCLWDKPGVTFKEMIFALKLLQKIHFFYHLVLIPNEWNLIVSGFKISFANVIAVSEGLNKLYLLLTKILEEHGVLHLNRWTPLIDPIWMKA